MPGHSGSWIWMFAILLAVSDAFVVVEERVTPAVTAVTAGMTQARVAPRRHLMTRQSRSSTAIWATTPPHQQRMTEAQQIRRKELLARKGPFFKLNRFQGAVEFGSSANLVTNLDPQPNRAGISEWLSDGRGLALSIWDEKMMKDLGNSLYRLQTMKLQFVTIQLAPSVDVQMWTSPDPTTGEPVFSLQSVDFDPNIQLLPGVGLKASTLGIQIDVVGELRSSPDGRGVTGSISFATTGNLPPPLRVLPEGPLKMASDAINDTVVSFAVASFQKGAIRKYREFRAVSTTTTTTNKEVAPEEQT
jgi:Protein of unknown function (DUF1997)